jgi:hypothetical protein
MRGDQRDEVVRRAFRELREEDRRSLPLFDPGLARPASEPVARVASPRWLLSAAAAVLVAVGVGMAALHDRRPAQSGAIAGASTARLTTWASPTERLLLTAGRDLTAALPRVGAFDFGTFDAALASTKESDSTPLSR